MAAARMEEGNGRNTGSPGPVAWHAPTDSPRGSGRADRVAERPAVCAGQRPDQVGSSPTDARVRGVISKSGGNASLAGVG